MKHSDLTQRICDRAKEDNAGCWRLVVYGRLSVANAFSPADGIDAATAAPVAIVLPATPPVIERSS